MTRVLWQKEFRQHWPWFILLGLMIWVMVVFTSFVFNAQGTGAGFFTGIGFGLWLMMPVAGLILSHLLVSSEYQVKTQLFLEGLPLPRWRMLAVKLWLALFLSLIYAASGVMIGWGFSAGTEPVTPRFLGILLASACGWSGFVFGFFFAMGFLGRYRGVIFLIIAVTLVVIMTTTSIPLGEFPPYALINHNRFGLEREVWPVSDLKWTGLMIAGWVALSLLMGLAREGSIAAMLGQRMSYREKMFVGGGIAIAALTLISIYDKPKPEPFDAPGAVAEEWDGVRVFISPEKEGEPVDLEVALGSRLARELARQRDWLGIPREDFPRIYVIERTDIEEPDEIDWETVADPGAVLMYAGYRERGFSEDRFLAWTLSQSLRKYSLGRVGHEDRWWIVCGLEGLWELEHADSIRLNSRIQQAVHAVREHDLNLETIMGWSLYQEEAGWRAADAVAWMGLRHLAETRGMETVQRLARATVTQPFDRVDGRAVLWDYTHPVKGAFRRATGVSLEDFVEEWKAAILSQRPGVERGDS
jgi:ABC-type transport system involved in multi-copper enzyme maturation permease subunit